MRVPFASRRSDGSVLGVADVPRGRAADCVCLSCGRPVIARQGDVRAWHFAHEFTESAADLCEYSVYESIREAILWLLPKLERLRLPPVGNRPAEHIEPGRVDLKVDVGGTPVDARVITEGYELHLYITYAGRSLPKEISNSNGRLGILDLKIQKLIGDWGDDAISISRVRQWLEEEDRGKGWVQHRLLCNVQSVPAKTNRPAIRVEHHCVMCRSTWIGNPGVKSATCDKCGTHLYVKSKAIS